MADKIAYFIFEGYTEDIFYKSVLDRYLARGIQRKYKNLETGCGINRAVASYLYDFIKSNAGKVIYCYVFIDREGPRSKIPEFNGKAIEKELVRLMGNISLNRIAKIEAVQMIESWFFHDLQGICRHVGLACTKSLQKTYVNPERLNSTDLSKLFYKGKKNRYYKKGDLKFLSKLDINKIYSGCKDLRDGIQMINGDFI